jgi:hypothetical protein
MYVVKNEIGAKPLGMFLKTIHEFRTLDAICIRWPVIDICRCH